MKEDWVFDSEEGFLTFFLPTKKQVAVTLTLWGIFQRSQVKIFTIQECGTKEENQRRAHDFRWLAKEKIKEARRQS